MIGKIRFLRLIVAVCLSYWYSSLLFSGAHSTGKPRPSSVETAFVEKKIQSLFAEVEGRMVSEGKEAVTASINGIVVINELRLGDYVREGQVIARQDSRELRFRKKNLQVLLVDARLEHDELEADINTQQLLLEIDQQQVEIFSNRANRAADLRKKNTLSQQELETSVNAKLNAEKNLFERQNLIASKQFQLQQAASRLSRLRFDMEQLRLDIKETNLVAHQSGQVIFLKDYSRSFAREGEIIAEILSPRGFEVDAEIPVQLIEYLKSVKMVDGHSISGTPLKLKPRVLLPVQNIRTATRTMRFSVIGQLDPVIQAENALVMLRIPSTEQIPVLTIPKDALIPVGGRHIVFSVEDGKAVKKRIRLGDPVGESFIVLNGLVEGEEVVVRGNEQLTDGKSVSKKNSGGLDKKRVVMNSRPQIKGDLWKIEWTTPRGVNDALLTVSETKAFFDDKKIDLIRAGSSINFLVERQRPFGPIVLEFTGIVKGDKMSGELVIRGLPSGADRVVAFLGEKEST